MIKSWKQFNEDKQLDLFQGTPYEKPELTHNNFYPIDEDDIRDYLAEIEDEGYLIVVNFGFYGDSGYTELINSYDVKPCISVDIIVSNKVKNDDVTHCVLSFIKRVSNKFKEIKVVDNGGPLNIDDIILKGGIFIKSESGKIEDELQIEQPLSIQLIWFNDIHINDKMIFDYYGIPQGDKITFTEKGSAQIEISREGLSDCVLSRNSQHKDIIDDPDYDIYQWYHGGDWLPDHDSFFRYHLEKETISMLIDCCFYNFDELKETSDFLNEFESLEDLKSQVLQPKDHWGKIYNKLGKYLDVEELAGNIYNELRSKYADFSMQAKADEDYEAVISEFDEIVEEVLETTIISKESYEEPSKYKIKDAQGNITWKETTIFRPYYKIDFNLEWFNNLDSEDLFDLGSVESQIVEWVYNTKEKKELNPRFSDYADVDDKMFNKEARGEIKWQIERKK